MKTRTTEARYRHSSNVAWRQVGDDAVVLDLETSVYFVLNETGMFIWERLGQGAVPQEIRREVCRAYEIDEAAADKEIRRLIKKLCSEKLLAAV